jgi:hypothetical protein
MSKENVLKLQKKLRLINENGSILTITFEDGFGLRIMIDRFIVLDSETENEAKIMFRMVGYDNGGPQHIKIFDFTDIVPEDPVNEGEEDEQWVEFDMTDDQGRKYRVEMLLDIIDPAGVKTWKKWKEYRAVNAEFFQKIDSDMIKSFPFASLDD